MALPCTRKPLLKKGLDPENFKKCKENRQALSVFFVEKELLWRF